MQAEGQEAPTLDRLTELEQQIGDLALPVAETAIVRAFGPKGEVFYAAQAYRYTAKPLDYYAIRLRKLGHIRYIGNRERPLYVSTVVASEPYRARDNAVYAIVNTSKRMVAIGPKQDGGLADPEDRGMGLGSYALSQIVRWLKTQYPGYRVSKCLLAEIEAEDRERRDRCLSLVGFSVVYTSRQGKGYFYANSVAELQEHINTKKVEEIGIDGLFATFAAMQEWHKELSNDFDALRKDRDKLVHRTIPQLKKRVYAIGGVLLTVGAAAGAAIAYVLLHS